METIYCYNDPCETEATHFYITSKGARFYLCYTCKEAFELGQVNAETDITDIDDEDLDDEESEAA